MSVKTGIELCLGTRRCKTSLKVELDTYSLDRLAIDPAGVVGLGTNPVLCPSLPGADLHSLQHFIKAAPAHVAVIAFLGQKGTVQV